MQEGTRYKLGGGKNIAATFLPTGSIETYFSIQNAIGHKTFDPNGAGQIGGQQSFCCSAIVPIGTHVLVVQNGQHKILKKETK